MTVSAIYHGTVRHRRFAERRREFEHGIAMAYLDLEELPRLLGGRLVAERLGMARFRRSDYFGQGPLADAVRSEVRAQAGSAPDGPVRVLTQLRSFGHCFNPVSFYYCFDQQERLAAVLTEVTNTPWGERQSYVLVRGQTRGRVLQGDSEKLMHVSPFFGMDQRYDWRIAEPADTLSVHIENHERETKVFDATLSLTRRELTKQSLAHTTARYPFATLRILALIYGHAAALRLKGVTTYPKPAKSGTVPYA